MKLLVAVVLLLGCVAPETDPGPARWVSASDGGACVEGSWEAAAGAWEAVRGRALREDCQEVWQDFVVGINTASKETPCTEHGETYNGCTMYSHRIIWITHDAVYRLIEWDVWVHEWLHVILSCEGESGNHEHETPGVWLPDMDGAEQIARDSYDGRCRGIFD